MVPRDYVRHLMRHHARQLGFVGLENQAGVYKEKPTPRKSSTSVIRIFLVTFWRDRIPG
jgi:hypothetical protein